jgi:hypothetical protein
MDIVSKFPDLNFFVVIIDNPMDRGRAWQLFASLETSLALRHVINMFEKLNVYSIDVLDKKYNKRIQGLFNENGLCLAELETHYSKNDVALLEEDYLITKLSGVTQ